MDPPEHWPEVNRIWFSWQAPPGHWLPDTHSFPALLPPRHTNPISPLLAPGKRSRDSAPLFETTRSSRESPLRSAKAPCSIPELACSELRFSSPPAPSFTRTRTRPRFEMLLVLELRMIRSALREQAAPTL